jgi:hypothetical protein
MVAAMRMCPEGVIERDLHVGQGPIIQLRHDVVSFKGSVCWNLTVSGCRNLNILRAAVDNVEFRMEPVGGGPTVAGLPLRTQYFFLLVLEPVVVCNRWPGALSEWPGLPRNKARWRRFSGMSKIDILDKPIERIQETCAMTGIADQFDRALPELETFLEGEVANGETSETPDLRRAVPSQANPAAAIRNQAARATVSRGWPASGARASAIALVSSAPNRKICAE